RQRENSRPEKREARRSPRQARRRSQESHGRGRSPGSGRERIRTRQGRRQRRQEGIVWLSSGTRRQRRVPFLFQRVHYRGRPAPAGPRKRARINRLQPPGVVFCCSAPTRTCPPEAPTGNLAVSCYPYKLSLRMAVTRTQLGIAIGAGALLVVVFLGYLWWLNNQ